MRRGRKDNNKAREQAKKRRAAIIRNGEKKIVVEQGNTKGYNLLEIRDFLDQLLLELRAQHYENQNILKALKATDDLQSAIKSGQEVSEKLVKQLSTYFTRYQAVLIESHFFDHTNTTDAEQKVIMTAFLRKMWRKGTRRSVTWRAFNRSLKKRFVVPGFRSAGSNQWRVVALMRL